MNPLVPLPARPTARPDAQRGAVLVLAVVLLTVLIGVAAVAVDLAGLRQDRRSHRAAADFAALAASGALVGDPADACQRAWSTVRSNLTEDTASASWSPGCSTFTTPPCDAATPRQAVATVGRYEVAIVHPVPDGHALMTGTGGTTQAIEPAIDGTACERMAVRIRSNRTYFFGRVFGINSGSTTVHAVGRASLLPPQPGEAVALLVLDPSGCNALRASGGAGSGGVFVLPSLPDADGVRAPGNIHLDSNGSTCSNNAVTVSSSGGSTIESFPSPTSGLPGRIALRALPPGATTCVDKGCDPADVSGGRLKPQPIPTPYRIGRGVVDHRYNCKSSYPFPDQPWWNGTVAPCTTGGSAHIDQLRASYQTSLPAAEGWQTWTNCNPNGAVTLEGNWFVNCSPKLSISNAFTITGNAVFANSVDVQAGGQLTIGNGAVPRFAYFRNGSFNKAGQATVNLRQVTVYLHSGSVAFSGGGGLFWTGPASGPLEGLALWSESGGAHSLAGGAVNEVYGVFFAPNVGQANSSHVFTLSGNGQQTQFQAQFITYRLTVTGGARLEMESPPIITLPQPDRYESRLIR